MISHSLSWVTLFYDMMTVYLTVTTVIVQVQRLYVNRRTNKALHYTDRAAQIYRALTEAQCIVAFWILKRACIKLLDRLQCFKYLPIVRSGVADG